MSMDMEARKVGVAHGWMWLKQGFWLFKQNPFIWMVLTSILVVGTFGIALFPVVGGALSTILFPAFFAGLMLGCHALAGEQELELMHLFSGFQKHAARLVTLGGIDLAGKLLIVGAIMLGGGENLVAIMTSGQPPEDPEVVLQAFTEAGIMFPLGVLLSVVLETCVLFAVLLVLFRELAPLPALLGALRAFLRNALPFLVYGLMLLPLAVLASLPWMLGWLVLLPITITSQYAIYRDLFPMKGDVPAAPADGAPDDHAPTA